MLGAATLRARGCHLTCYGAATLCLRLLEEAELEQLVRFVHDEQAHRVQREAPFLDEGHQSQRRAHERIVPGEAKGRVRVGAGQRGKRVGEGVDEVEREGEGEGEGKREG